jgi:3-oxoacyl-[acyl-carrier-protein] synthase II
VLVLEELQHALARGASPLAEVRGCGLSGDGYHITSPPADGSGAVRAMRAAVAQSGLHCDTLDYLNAHATSTPLGDAAEATAIDTVFSNRCALAVCAQINDLYDACNVL